MEPLLRIQNLTVGFDDGENRVQVVHGLNLWVEKGEILGLVGESGCGKSISCLSILRLLGPYGHINGSIQYDGQDLLSFSEDQMTRLRCRDIAVIFQDPIGALNPVKAIGKQIMEAIRLNADEPSAEGNVRKTAVRLLKEVGMPDPQKRLKEYPHQLSGGQNQRAMIAMMLAGAPGLLIADEPTTALDVTIQAQILQLLKDLREKKGMAIILVTHDLGVVANTCDRMAVMYCGRIVETGPVKALFSRPRHPYTFGLLHSRPRVDQRTAELIPIKGIVPTPLEVPKACAFEPRCFQAVSRCKKEVPIMTMKDDNHGVACFNSLSGNEKRGGHVTDTSD